MKLFDFYKELFDKPLNPLYIDNYLENKKDPIIDFKVYYWVLGNELTLF